MARSLRASAAAAAKKILAQAADDGDAAESAPAAAKATTRRGAAAKRKREESLEYEGDAAEGESEDESEDDEEESDGGDGGSYAVKKEGELDETKPHESVLPAKAPAVKKRKKSSSKDGVLERRLFSRVERPAAGPLPPCCPPERLHSVDYHRPLLLDGAAGRAARRALLAWYDGVSASRGMPWRREAWLNPDDCLGNGDDDAGRDALARRAYEVWISEVMAQQTRIAVVIGYWTRWMARWPTVADLAAAQSHEVMHEWSGLGYYSRAARLHEAARVVVADPAFRGLLPADVATLEARVPGVGRYTAGAISAIVFGRPAAMVDGNVIRVLSRQLGVFADSKAEKALVDLLWAAAEALVQAVAHDGEEGEDAAVADDMETAAPAISDRPGRWGQALMELGSTVCAPKPDCAACPISSTCRAYAEGLVLYERQTKGKPVDSGGLTDIEDACDLCEQFPELDDEEAAALAKADKKGKNDKKVKAKPDPRKKTTQSPFFDVEDAAAGITISDEALATIVNHARTFPLRRPKKPVREVETLVCAVRAAGDKKNKGGLYLLHQRPAKGLLARLWQLPSYDLPAALDGKAARRKEAEAFVARWLRSGGSCSCGGECATIKTGGKKGGKTVCTAQGSSAAGAVRTTKVRELGSIPWLFSHLRQTMHVYLFEVASEDGARSLPTPAACCWASVKEAEETYSMGTGMRKCWDLVTNA